MTKSLKIYIRFLPLLILTITSMTPVQASYMGYGQQGPYGSPSPYPQNYNTGYSPYGPGYPGGYPTYNKGAIAVDIGSRLGMSIIGAATAISQDRLVRQQQEAMRLQYDKALQQQQDAMRRQQEAIQQQQKALQQQQDAIRHQQETIQKQQETERRRKMAPEKPDTNKSLTEGEESVAKETS